MSPVEQLAGQMTDATALIYTALTNELDSETRAVVARVIAEQRPAMVQCYIDHFRTTLTDEQIAEVAVYAARPKPLAWDRYESACRVAGEKVGEMAKAAMERALK